MSLLVVTQGLIERTYRTASGVQDLSAFVLGDEGYRRLARRHRIVQVIDEHAPQKQNGSDEPVADAEPAGPRVLLRQSDGGAAVLSIYFPDGLIRRLEAHPPTRALDGGNVDDFAAFVEEIDHFVMLSHGYTAGREVNLLELELRANVSKALVVSHFLGRLSGRRRLRAAERIWVRYHLFEKHRYCDVDERVRRRYVEARRLAVRLLDRLERLATSQRLAELRRWNSLPPPRKLRELDVN